MRTMNSSSKRAVATVLSSIVVLSFLSACNLTPPEVEEETSSSVEPQPHPGKDAGDKEPVEDEHGDSHEEGDHADEDETEEGQE